MVNKVSVAAMVLLCYALMCFDVLIIYTLHKYWSSFIVGLIRYLDNIGKVK